jgi:hypothetical protein
MYLYTFSSGGFAEKSSALRKAKSQIFTNSAVSSCSHYHLDIFTATGY